MKRWVWPILLLLVLSGGAALCIARWNAWFGNEAEPTYFVPAEPSNIVLTVGEDAAHSRTLTWRTEQVEQAYVLLTHPTGETDTVAVAGEMVMSRAGEAAYYAAHFDSLSNGDYIYTIMSDNKLSAPGSFRVAPDSVFRFWLFGDIQAPEYPSSFSSFVERRGGAAMDSIAFFAYVGDVIERPTDMYWQVWFRSMNGLQQTIAQVPATGNHEYLKGIQKELDSRWTHIFSMPGNGPQRFLGKTYYIDYPMLRLIVLDTDALQRLSDFTVAQTWLCRELMEAGDKWKVVVMHHPVHSVGAGRWNFNIASTFHETLKRADIVFAGHDHNYGRFIDRHRMGHHLLSAMPLPPVYIVTTSSDKYYLASLSPNASRIGTCDAFYEDVLVSPDSLVVYTRFIANDSLYDVVGLTKEERVVLTAADLLPDTVSLPSERLEIPSRYAGKNTLRIRRFQNAKSTRDHHE